MTRDDAPDRIWIEEVVGCPYFYDASELAEAGGPLIEYIRADLAAPAPVVPAEGLDALIAEIKFETVNSEIDRALAGRIITALRSAPPVGARVSIPFGLIDALRSQRQIDADGCEVAVSRQACDEAAAILAALLPAGEGE